MKAPNLSLLKRLYDFLVERNILTLVVILVVTHAILITVNIGIIHRYHKMHVILHRRSVQQINNIIRMVNSTPKHVLPYAISALNITNTNITLSKKPKWHPRFTKKNDITHITNTLMHDSDPYKHLSYRIQPHLWLNIVSDVGFYKKRKTVFVIAFIEAINLLFILIYVWAIINIYPPLRELKKSAEKFAEAGASTKLPLRGPGMIRAATESMNQMQERITNLLKERTLILAALSHDLRTPITRLRLRAHFLHDEDVKTKIYTDLDDIETMINETIIFAKQDYTEQNKQQTDLNSLLKTICDEAEDLNLPVTYKSEFTRIPILGNPSMLRRAFYNVIINAIKYGKIAHVELYSNTDHIFVSVTDEGPGLPEKDINKIFDPFYRVEASRSKETGGLGLGLAIVKSIITSHGGTVTVSNMPEKGLRILIKLNLKQHASEAVPI